VTLDALRGFLQIGFVVGACGLVSALLQPQRESAGFVLSVCSAMMGFTLIGGALLLGRWLSRAPTPVSGGEEETTQHD
jgi:hypothetical protein